MHVSGFQGIKVRFAVIEGSREWTEPTRPATRSAVVSILVEDVEAEARRRLRSCRLQEWRTREFITGRPMPDDVRHYALQVEFAAQAISRLSPIPEDFDSDVYWPRMLDL
ncbi:MAG: hypothetical protein KJ944_08385 [Alphaproteobacteria bacterium]|jgi:hypothetical protein|nr:hypothetical protein [Alphaproteobacteria bacterium]MBU1560117.1 hypothetical protein [Alphaproteobacteria bacterium]MBU2302599.1 hypothetical protein [Alphaproteobacteria bacterium]MBU2367587.1 hypothetical protein [Alphaproteobacteria bacterium]